MKNVMDLVIQADMEKFREWLEMLRIDELAVLVSEVPEQRFALMKKGRLVESTDSDSSNFVIDGEMVRYQEVDGQYEPEFETIQEVIRLDFKDLKDGRIEIHGKVKEIVRLTEKLEKNLMNLSSRIRQAYPDVE